MIIIIILITRLQSEDRVFNLMVLNGTLGWDVPYESIPWIDEPHRCYHTSLACTSDNVHFLNVDHVCNVNFNDHWQSDCVC
jgi:hypothetical protein